MWLTTVKSHCDTDINSYDKSNSNMLYLQVTVYVIDELYNIESYRKYITDDS